MNSASVPATSGSSNAKTFLWLLKREYWENRGSFVRAPLIIGIILLLMTALLSVLVASQFHVQTDGVSIDFSSDNDGGLGQLGDLMLWIGVGNSAVVLAFIVFFYALGSLYDDRRDRSILFWRSLPIADTQMVLSKALWALLLAPLLFAVIGLLLGLCLWAISLAVAAISGGASFATLLGQSHPLSIAGKTLASVPIQMLWSLPSIGWLMMCSAWARSKPFVWAALAPVLTCVLISMMGILPGVSLPLGKIWYVIVFRGLLGVIPAGWLIKPQPQFVDDLPSATHLLDSAETFRGLHILASPDLWIGVAIGIAFIAAAIYFRCNRDDG
ncbi:MAG: ABC transporter permease [Xanthomonadaceae bacterium]|jgi:ABC-2 type transport system permease protein|nr:ABC transporter permease [Xanthomonadaceae bacterium]